MFSLSIASLATILLNSLISVSGLLAQQEAPGGPEAAAGGLLGLCCVGFFVILGMASFGFWIWMLIDCVSNEPNVPGSNDKVIWIIVIVLTQGLGALLYFFIRRPKRKAEHGK